MIQKIYKDYLVTKSYKKGSILNQFLKTIFSPSLICMFFFRLSHFFYFLKMMPIAKLIWWINFLLFKVDLDFRAEIKAGIYMPHPIGIVIGSGVKIYGNLKIMQGVCIGGNLSKSKKFKGLIITQPQILKGGFIGINAIILGPIILKEKIFISANATISKSFSESVFLYNNNFSKDMHQTHINEINILNGL